MNGHWAELIAGQEELQVKYEETRLAIGQNTATSLELDLDMARFDSPGLDSVEIETLQMLASISLTATRASQPPVPSAPARPAAAVVKNNNDRLISQLLAKLPELTAEEADNYIQILREKNHGKLSGLSVVDIKNGVEELWRKEVGAAAGGVGAVGFRRGRPSGGQQLAGAGEEEEKVPECSICLEKMGGADYMELNPCKHSFHGHCIRVSLEPVVTSSSV